MKRSQFVLTGLMILLYAAFISTGVAYTQDDYPDSEPTDTGTPGLVKEMDDLNLPLIPPPPDSPPPAPTQVAPPILPNTPTTPPTGPKLPDIRSLGGRVTTVVVTSRGGANIGPAGTINVLSDRPFGVKTNIKWAAVTDTQVTLHRQAGDPVYSYTNPTTGNTINVFSDYTFEVTDDSGTIIMTGNFGMAGDADLVAIGVASDGTRYAFHGRHFSAFTPDGDVLIGNAAVVYTYHFDQDGAFLSLNDSDGGEYQVESDASGGVSIDGPDGYKVQADETGVFELYDAAGNLVVQGELFDTTNDEFANFDASLAGGEYGSDYGGYGSSSDYSSGSDYSGSSDYSSGSDYSGGGDYSSGGDEYGSSGGG
jgi:hypothetical protein